MSLVETFKKMGKPKTKKSVAALAKQNWSEEDLDRAAHYACVTGAVNLLEISFRGAFLDHKKTMQLALAAARNNQASALEWLLTTSRHRQGLEIDRLARAAAEQGSQACVEFLLANFPAWRRAILTQSVLGASHKGRLSVLEKTYPTYIQDFPDTATVRKMHQQICESGHVECLAFLDNHPRTVPSIDRAGVWSTLVSKAVATARPQILEHLFTAPLWKAVLDKMDSKSRTQLFTMLLKKTVHSEQNQENTWRCAMMLAARVPSGEVEKLQAVLNPFQAQYFQRVAVQRQKQILEQNVSQCAPSVPSKRKM